jgi:hypothetical protein
MRETADVVNRKEVGPLTVEVMGRKMVGEK